MENILNEFNNNLREIINSPLSNIYITLFSIIPEDEFISHLEYLKGEYEKEPDDWFYYLHKSIRQTYFFGNNLSAFILVNKLTEEEKKVRDFLLNDPLVERDLRVRKITPEIKELSLLNKKANAKNDIQISGILDIILYNLIHLDIEQDLKNAMEKTFKLYGKRRECEKDTAETIGGESNI